MNHGKQQFLLAVGLTVGLVTQVQAAKPRLRVEQIALSPTLELAQGYLGWIANSLFQHYQLAYPAPALTTGLSPQQVGQVQIQFVRRLKEDMGPVVGFKAALTSETAQRQFGVSQPLLGFLLEQMLLESGATLPADFGARPVSEGDLMVRVGSEAINQAETDADLLASLDAVIPFIELPDLVYQVGARVDAGALVAANVGARYGVLGEPMALTPETDWYTQLGQIRVRMINDRGQTIASGESHALLGHPLNVVRWLRDTLKAQGVTLKPGDLLSLGTITPPMSVEAGTTVRARYYFGAELNHSAEVRVTFESPE
jgi:2-keto-4-pentenoate hydratase